MAGDFSGTPEDFAMAHQKVNEARLQLNRNLQRLANEIETTHARSPSEEVELFQELMRKFAENSTKLNHVLEHIVDILKASGVRHRARDEDVRQQITSLQVALEGM